MHKSVIPLKLSLVIPVYNEEDHIEACLDAVAAQTVMPHEVIVVDNNSTDNTAALAQKYEFVTLVTETEQGVSYARNRGFDLATGDIIGRIDADSRLPENWVEHVSSYMSGHENHLITGGSYFYDLAWPYFFGWIQGQVAFRMNLLILGHYISWGSNMALHKNHWQMVKNELHNDPSIHEDIDLSMHLHKRGIKIHYEPGFKVGVDSRLSSEQRSNRADHMKYLKMWPKTLSLHRHPNTWIGWVGVYLVYLSYTPMLAVNHIGKLKSYLKSLFET